MPCRFYRRGVDIQAAMDASYEVADLLAAHASGTKDDDGCDANSLSLRNVARASVQVWHVLEETSQALPRRSGPRILKCSLARRSGDNPPGYASGDMPASNER